MKTNTESTSGRTQTRPRGIAIVYDGECPFCSRYVALLRLRETVGHVELIDARTPHPLVDEVVQRGFDINEGMVVKIADAYHGGADCIHVLSLLSTRAGVFNRINYWLFRSSAFSAALYPVLRFGRNMTLLALGRKKISRTAGNGPPRPNRDRRH